MIRRFFLVSAILIPLLLPASAFTEPAGAAPSDVVKQFQSNLLAVMKEANTTNVRQRFDRLTPTVRQSFHLPLMTQIAAGSYWNKATPTERGNLVSAFRRMSISTLAYTLASYLLRPNSSRLTASSWAFTIIENDS